mmetsp:Transcript_23203/g.63698  ORF Transcript_23203/g.63698 Transcript_23203/m.63698 type:complete len:223 (+) Transcript_23203:930-1598(+)
MRQALRRARGPDDACQELRQRLHVRLVQRAALLAWRAQAPLQTLRAHGALARAGAGRAPPGRRGARRPPRAAAVFARRRAERLCAAPRARRSRAICTERGGRPDVRQPAHRPVPCRRPALPTPGSGHPYHAAGRRAGAGAPLPASGPRGLAPTERHGCRRARLGLAAGRRYERCMPRCPDPRLLVRPPLMTHGHHPCASRPTRAPESPRAPLEPPHPPLELL